MANTQGSLENPFCIDDIETLRPSRPDKGKAKAYYELHDDKPPTELPVDELSAVNRALDRGKSNRGSNYNATPDRASSSRRLSNFTTNKTSRTPAKPGVGDEVITIDDDEPYFTPQTPQTLQELLRSQEQLRRELLGDASFISSEAKDVIPSRSGVHPVPLTSSLPLSGHASPRFGQPQASSHLESRAGEKEKVTPPTSRLVNLLVGDTAELLNTNGALARPTEESWRGPAPISHRYNHHNNANGTFPHINAAQVDMEDQRSLNPPIGGRAGHEREQTTSRRVETNATSIPARVNVANEVGKTTDSPEVSERARKGGDLPAFRLLSKPRAIKTASSAPWRTSGNERSVHQPAKNHAHSPSSEAGSKGKSHSASVSRRRDVDERPAEASSSSSGHQKENPELHRVVRERSSNAIILGTVSTPSSVEPTAMGAQISTSTATPLPLLSSDTTPGNASTIPTLSSRLNPLDLRSHDANVITTPKPPEPVEHSERSVSLSELYSDAEKDIITARRRIEETLKHRLDERYEEHAYLVKNLIWRQRTCYERETIAQVRHKANKTVPMLAEKYQQTDSPFQNMPGVQCQFEKNSNKELQGIITQENFTKAATKDNVVRSTWSVPIRTHTLKDLQLPSFKEYVSLKTNILADNESKLLTLPWLGDDEPEQRQKTLIEDLPKQYEIRHDINALLDLRDEQCRFYSDSVDTFLADVGITWDMMLYWLLSSETYLQQINQSLVKHDDFERVVLDRSPYDRDAFRRDGQELEPILFECDRDQWQSLLHQLQEPTAVQIRLVALSCAALIANCGFSPWYMAKQRETMKNYVKLRTRHSEVVSKFEFRNIMCRVCHEHNCLFHGEIREDPESDAVSEISEESSEDDVENSETHDISQRSDYFREKNTQRSDNHGDDDDDDDSDDDLVPVHYDSDDSYIEKVVNYRFPANSVDSTNDKEPHYDIPKRPIPPSGPFKPRWWELNTSTVNWEKRKPFVPCSHTGSCIEAKCRCFRENVTCEKTCKCPSTCNRRFPGCKCASIPGKRTCATVTGCICIKFKRECDADLCGTCGATELLDPVNRYNEELLQDRCTNVGIQRGVPKKTLLGKSEVHGFGLYAGQDIRKDDVIGEYTGEILSVGESARREIVYVYEKNMYLFKLNKEQEVDATHMGNKLRFINNANRNLSNCCSQVMFCNTVFRVALYANTDIKAGTEFFFNYNYPEEMTKLFKQPKGKVVAVKQVVNQPSKAKSKRGSSHSSSNNDPAPSATGAYVDRPWVREALAKARAAKAAKREAMLAEKANQAMTTTSSSTALKPGLKQARKSASGPSSYQKPNVPDARGPTGVVGGSNSREGSTASKSAMEADDDGNINKVIPTLVVQDTDEDTNTDAEERDNDDIPQSTAKPRASMAKKSASIVAVKKVKNTGGGRLSLGRKRKRPLVANSDEE